MEKLEHHILSIKKLQESLNSNLEKLNLNSLTNEISDIHSIVKNLDKQLIIFEHLKKNIESSEQVQTTITSKSTNSSNTFDQKPEDKNDFEKIVSIREKNQNPEQITENLSTSVIENQDINNPTSLQEEKQQALADKFMKKGIEKLSASIGISEKFLFIHELFKGDTELYIKELNKLDNCGNLKTADELLEKLSKDLNWNIEAHAYLELKKLIDRKYPI